MQKIFFHNFLKYLKDFLTPLCHVKLLNALVLKQLIQMVKQNVVRRIYLMLRCLRWIHLRWRNKRIFVSIGHLIPIFTNFIYIWCLDYVFNQASLTIVFNDWLWGTRVELIVGITHSLVVERSWSIYNTESSFAASNL